ncbi:MAG: outer membrane beta-barrel protein [Acidobacteria bacterium]|nr:outer membrane beta-barrel protein [Acidobacteriota bacterium]MBI3488382.1 outer membrane beta-barrel protein [Acidobacteriota bacterium]
MKRMLTTLSLGLLGSAFAFAQSGAPAPSTDQVVLSAGLVFAQGDSLDMTHKSSGGYGFEIGYQIAPKDFGAEVLFYGGWKKLPAATPVPGRATFELTGPNAGFDLVYKPWASLPVSLSTGPSIHVWQVEQQGVPNGKKGDQGLKLGWRAGVDYAINSEWSVGLKYTLTEWKSTPSDDPAQRFGPYRPAYLSLQASYRF